MVLFPVLLKSFICCDDISVEAEFYIAAAAVVTVTTVAKQ